MNLIVENLIKNQKKLNEAVDNSYTKDAFKMLLSLDQGVLDDLGIIAQPKNESTPLAWDNVIELDGDTVVIEGNVAPGGPEQGSVTIKVPFEKFKSLYELRADLSLLDEDSTRFTEEEKELILNLCNPY